MKDYRYFKILPSYGSDAEVRKFDYRYVETDVELLKKQLVEYIGNNSDDLAGGSIWRYSLYEAQTCFEDIYIYDHDPKKTDLRVRGTNVISIYANPYSTSDPDLQDCKFWIAPE